MQTKIQIQELLGEPLIGLPELVNQTKIERLQEAVLALADRIDHLYECKCEKPYER